MWRIMSLGKRGTLFYRQSLDGFIVKPGPGLITKNSQLVPDSYQTKELTWEEVEKLIKRRK